MMESCMCGCTEPLLVTGGLCLWETGDAAILLKAGYCDVMWSWDVARGINEGLFLLSAVKSLPVPVLLVTSCSFASETGAPGRYSKLWFSCCDGWRASRPPCFKATGFKLYKVLILLDNAWYSWLLKTANSSLYNKKQVLMANYSILLKIINGSKGKMLLWQLLNLFYKHILGDSRPYMYAIFTCSVYCFADNN